MRDRRSSNAEETIRHRVSKYERCPGIDLGSNGISGWLTMVMDGRS